MKNIKTYTTEEDVRTLLDQIFKTPHFRTAINEDPFLKRIFDRYCAFPRLTFEVSDMEYERGNFTSWFNALALRQYDSEAVNDLYYLHEITHIATMPYSKGNFAHWKKKVFQNELEASVVSEAYIYFLIPEFRTLSFKSEIWVDRFLKQGLESSEVYQTLLHERSRIQQDPNTEDPQEVRIHWYQQQNEVWAKIWEEDYLQIEQHMMEFYTTAATQPEQAIAQHVVWLKDEIQKNTRPFPFASQAIAFAKAGQGGTYLPETKVKGA